jgi:predicted nucleic acid-binding protein
MVKQNASLDASFWINLCSAGLVQYVGEFFVLFASTKVAEEIRYPLDVLGIASQTVTLFNNWLRSGEITLQDPKQPVDWFHPGENSAIALAIEHNYFLLIDDANPYHRAKAAGLRIVGSAEFAILLYDQGKITTKTAVSAIQQTHASKKQKRLGLTILENLKRLKES